jgi:hypothetical protein
VLDEETLRRRRAAAQLLHRPTAVSDPVEVARATAGIQAQDQPAARLSFRSRSRRLYAADIDRARTVDRSLLRTWLMRMTIHLIPTEDAAWMLPLFEPKIEHWSRRRLDQLGMKEADVARALRIVARALDGDGALTRPELGERVVAGGVELDSMTRLHVMGCAVVSGIACLGPDRGASACLVRRQDWLGDLPVVDRKLALAELARRYLGGFGPASDRDLAYWSGLGLREVRAGLEAIASELTEVRSAHQTLVALRRKGPRLPPRGHVRLLGNFDTYLLGYRDRSFSVPPEHAAAVKEGGGGWIRPVIVRDGLVVGGWSAKRGQGRIDVSLTLPDPEAAPREAIEAEIADIERFEGVTATLAT